MADVEEQGERNGLSRRQMIKASAIGARPRGQRR